MFRIEVILLASRGVQSPSCVQWAVFACFCCGLVGVGFAEVSLSKEKLERYQKTLSPGKACPTAHFRACSAEISRGARLGPGQRVRFC